MAYPRKRRATCHSFAPTAGAELVPDDHVVVLFGGTGDLARRKLLPGLFRLAEAGLLPECYRIIATSRGNLDGEFRKIARAAVEDSGHLCSEASWKRFAANLSFASQETLVAAVAAAEAAMAQAVRRLFYLSVPPVAFSGIVSMLGASGLSENARVVLEKPFGTDPASASSLNDTVHAAFYEKTGAYGDMIVTHLLQVLGFIAMEPPTSFSAKALLDETAKVAESLRPIRREDVVYGQYTGYRDESGVGTDSETSRSRSATHRVVCSARPTASDRTSSCSN